MLNLTSDRQDFEDIATEISKLVEKSFRGSNLHLEPSEAIGKPVVNDDATVTIPKEKVWAFQFFQKTIIFYVLKDWKEYEASTPYRKRAFFRGKNRILPVEMVDADDALHVSFREEDKISLTFRSSSLGSLRKLESDIEKILGPYINRYVDDKIDEAIQ